MRPPVLALLLVLSACARGPRHDVVLVTLDTTRADRLSCYGYGTETTPRIDSLAAGGTRFTRALSQAAVTPVAHASIMTGLLPYEHGLRVMHGVVENELPEEALTLSEVLRADGYATGAFVSAFPVTASFGFDQGFDRFDAEFLPKKLDRFVAANGVVKTGRAQRGAAETVEPALAWLAETPSPRFLWIHLFDPHDPLVLPPDEFMQAYEPLPTEERDRLRALYDAELTYMDRELGRVLDALPLESTVVCVTADHGEGLGDHDWWTHGVLYQEQVRVPLLLHGPGVPAGRVEEGLVRTMDVMPTLLELAGVPARPALDGVSLAPLLRGEPVDIPFAYADSVNLMVYGFSPTIKDTKDELLFMLCDGRFKYTHHLTRDTGELYDLQADPGERRNLHETEREVVQRMRAELERRPYLPLRQLEAQGGTPEHAELLKALGYSGD